MSLTKNNQQDTVLPIKQKRQLTKGEEIFNAVTHIVGAAFAIIGTIILLIFAIKSGQMVAIASSIIYGLSMIVLYTISSIYHFLRFNRAKKVFRILDHCSIYLLIAGTYTPLCLIALKDYALGWVLLGIVWGIAVLGITLNAINMHHKGVKIFSQISYIAMGWCVVIGIPTIIKVLSVPMLIWLVTGGVAYTLGVVFFALSRKVKYFHGIWHFFVLAGTMLQYICVLMVLLELL